MNMLVSLTPAESKRLIGRALAVHPLVQQAVKKGKILVSNGTTTGYFVEELLHEKLDIARFSCGTITGGVACITPDDRIRSVMIRDGIRVPNDPDKETYEELREFVSEMGAGDLYVKGANAIDAAGNAGYLLASPFGGNIMTALPAVVARGVTFLIPCGLEKMIASVPEAQEHMKGLTEYEYTFGLGCGYVMISNGIVFHEINALELLTGVKAWHTASGGVGGSEGNVTLVVEGDKEQIDETFRLLKGIKGEPAVGKWKRNCKDCTYRCRYIRWEMPPI